MLSTSIKPLCWVIIHLVLYPATRCRVDVVAAPLCTSQRCRRYISNEAPNEILVERHQEVSVMPILNDPLVCLYNVYCNSQTKHSITSLWYVSTTSPCYFVAISYLYYGLHYLFKLLCHDLHLVGFHISFKYQIKHQFFLVPTRRVTRGVV